MIVWICIQLQFRSVVLCKSCLLLYSTNHMDLDQHDGEFSFQSELFDKSIVIMWDLSVSWITPPKFYMAPNYFNFTPQAHYLEWQTPNSDTMDTSQTVTPGNGVINTIKINNWRYNFFFTPNEVIMWHTSVYLQTSIISIMQNLTITERLGLSAIEKEHDSTCCSYITANRCFR